jgi:hypothetical protein
MDPQPEGSCTDQVTDASDEPVTDAVNVTDCEKPTVAELGLTPTVTGTAVTVTTAPEVIDGSATDRATTWKVPVPKGATYRPEASIVPPPASVTVQVTDVLTVPVTAAENLAVSRGTTSATLGSTTTATPVWDGAWVLAAGSVPPHATRTIARLATKQYVARSFVFILVAPWANGPWFGDV